MAVLYGFNGKHSLWGGFPSPVVALFAITETHAIMVGML